MHTQHAFTLSPVCTVCLTLIKVIMKRSLSHILINWLHTYFKFNHFIKCIFLWIQALHDLYFSAYKILLTRVQTNTHFSENNFWHAHSQLYCYEHIPGIKILAYSYEYRLYMTFTFQHTKFCLQGYKQTHVFQKTIFGMLTASFTARGTYLV